MPTLSEYTNVYNSALQLLRKKGFQVWIDKPLQLFCAERDGWDFMAESPVGLLGLVAMYECLEPAERFASFPEAGGYSGGTFLFRSWIFLPRRRW